MITMADDGVLGFVNLFPRCDI